MLLSIWLVSFFLLFWISKAMLLLQTLRYFSFLWGSHPCASAIRFAIYSWNMFLCSWFSRKFALPHSIIQFPLFNPKWLYRFKQAARPKLANQLFLLKKYFEWKSFLFTTLDKRSFFSRRKWPKLENVVSGIYCPETDEKMITTVWLDSQGLGRLHRPHTKNLQKFWSMAG